MITVALLAIMQTASFSDTANASVYHVSPRVDIPVTVGASLGFALPYLFAKHLITLRCPCDPREVNAFDRSAIGNHSTTAATLSDLTVSAVIVGPLVFDMLKVGPDRAFLDDAVVFTQTLAINGALVTAVKFIAQRPLPLTYAGDSVLIHSPRGYRSFYSGHTSMVFAGLSAAAMTMRLRYGKKTWPWIVTAIVGSSVAIERVAAGQHFPSDVIVGALMGTATGIVVPRLHASRQPRVVGSAFRTRGGPGIGLSYAF